MSRNDYIDYTNERTFKQKLRKLYRLVLDEGSRVYINLNDFSFINCQGYNDIIDINYTNYVKDFSVSVRGSEKRGYRVLNAVLDDALTDEDFE